MFSNCQIPFPVQCVFVGDKAAYYPPPPPIFPNYSSLSYTSTGNIGSPMQAKLYENVLSIFYSCFTTKFGIALFVAFSKYAQKGLDMNDHTSLRQFTIAHAQQDRLEKNTFVHGLKFQISKLLR